MDDSICLKDVTRHCERALDEELFVTYVNFETLSKKFSELNQGYQHNAYMCYVAAHCLA